MVFIYEAFNVVPFCGNGCPSFCSGRSSNVSLESVGRHAVSMSGAIDASSRLGTGTLLKKPSVDADNVRFRSSDIVIVDNGDRGGTPNII